MQIPMRRNCAATGIYSDPNYLAPIISLVVLRSRRIIQSHDYFFSVNFVALNSKEQTGASDTGYDALISFRTTIPFGS